MQVFISWSGHRSHQVALVLRDWLPQVIQSVAPWVSSEDIDKGARWSSDIGARLEQTEFGIVCLTEESQASAWVNFEAGALAKQFESGKVATFLFGLKPADVTGPLTQFQHTVVSKEDVLKLVRSINKSVPEPIADSVVVSVVNMWWPSLEEALDGILEIKPEDVSSNRVGSQPLRSDRELLEEVTEIVRELQRNLARVTPSHHEPPVATGSVSMESQDLVADLRASESVDTSVHAITAAEAAAANTGWNIELATSWCDDLWNTQNGRLLFELPIYGGGYATSEQMRRASGRTVDSPHGLTGFTGGVTRRFKKWAAQNSQDPLEFPVTTDYNPEILGRQRARGFVVNRHLVPLFKIALELTRG